MLIIAKIQQKILKVSSLIFFIQMNLSVSLTISYVRLSIHGRTFLQSLLINGKKRREFKEKMSHLCSPLVK